MQQLQVFNFKGADVRTVMVNGEPFWVAADVCSILGIKQTASAMRMLRPHEKGVHLVHTPGGEQEMTVIPESGLYKLICKSPKVGPEFEDWVFGDVLPTIRKTGGYSVAPVDPLARLSEYVITIDQARAKQIEAVGAQVTEQAERLAAVEEQVKQTDPKVIEDRMFRLHQLKKALVEGTKETHQPVTFRAYWCALQEHCRIASFQQRMGLTVEKLDNAIKHAELWCFARGITPPPPPPSQGDLFPGGAA